MLIAIGWAAALSCSALAAYRAWSMARIRRHAHTGKRLREDSLNAGNWVALLLWSGLAVAAFTLLGVISPLIGGLYAGTAAVIVLVAARPWTREGRHTLRAHGRYGVTEPVSAIGKLWRRLLMIGGSGDGDDGGDAIPLEAVTEHAATRSIPPVMADPLLGPATEPAAIASTGIPVPPPYAALAQFIGGFEPEDDQALRMFMEGCAMGSTVVGEAWHHFADTILNGVGLSPAYVAGILEAGDSAGEHASLLAQVHKRFGVVYAAVKEWIAAHGPLPHKARDFLTGEEG